MNEPDSALERLVVFVAAIGGDRVRQLLEGLGETLVGPARTVAEHFAVASSSERQALMSRHFGEAVGAAARLRRAFVDAGPALQTEMWRRLPVYHRALFPDLDLSTAAPATPLVAALADRWIRIATR